MEFQSANYTIDALVQRVRTSRLALPDFQRDFVWKPNEVVELLDSVAKQWPIGSMLLLNGPQSFATKDVASGPKVSRDDLEAYILDGQQRITSLYHAIMDVSEFCYYVDFSALENDFDEFIRWERRDRFLKLYPTIEKRAAARLALIAEIWDSQSFYKWLECLGESTPKFLYVSLRDSKLGGLQTKVYKVMAIELQQEISLEALARIFETLNRTGVQLNAYDLMIAALYPSGFRLKDEWEAAINEFSILGEVTPNALEVLKLTALIIRLNEGRQASAGVRQGDLLKIERSLIIQYWPESLELYVRSLEYCSHNFGIKNAELVPSWSMILGVAGWLINKNVDQKRISDWWMHRLVTQYFSQAANTRIVSDFENISSLLVKIPYDLPVEQLTIFSESIKKNGLLAKGFAGLLIQSGARDLVTGETFTSSDKVVFRAVTPDGYLVRVSSVDNFSVGMILTDKSDRTLGKNAKLTDHTFAHDALRSQGISIDSFKRDTSYLFKLFSIN